MGAVDTTYTFTATDTITSTKMNNIIDQTTITGDAIIGTTLEVSSGKLKVRAAGITSNEMGSASVTQPALAPNVVGNGPAFRAYPSSSQSIATATDVKVLFQTEEYDTNDNFANSRFTPTVEGYYLIKGSVGYAASRTSIACNIFKNGVHYSSGPRISADSSTTSAIELIYLNGSTDYVEIYTRHLQGTTVGLSDSSLNTNFCGCLIRSA